MDRSGAPPRPTQPPALVNGLLTALSPAALLFGLIHGLFGAWFLLQTNYDLQLEAATLGAQVLAAVAVVGLLVGVVGAASIAWQLFSVSSLALERRLRGLRSRVGNPEPLEPDVRGVGSFTPLVVKHVALALGLLAAMRLQLWLMDSGDVVAGIFTGLWFLAALSCGAGRLLVAYFVGRRRPDVRAALVQEGRLLPTAGALIEAAPPTWSFIVVVEAIFHHGAGTWVPMLEASALLRHMSDEAEAMLLGPEAVRLGSLIFGFATLATVWAISWRLHKRRAPRHARSTRLLAVWLVIVAAGGAALAASQPRMARLIAHHSHPSVHTLAGALTPSLSEQLQRVETDAAAAARRLFPQILTEAGLPSPQLTGPADAAPIVEHAAPQARNALIVFIDSISRRHLEPWGYPRPVDPHMAKLAAESIRFDQARSNAGQTDLATIALFYSLLPVTHLDKGHTYAHGHGGVPVHLHAERAGFAVGLFSADWEVHDVGHAALHPKQCGAFLDARISRNEAEAAEVVQWAGRRESEVVSRFLRWHDAARKAGKRTFSYVKFLRPHAPYYTPADTDDWHPPFHPAADGYNVFDFRPPASRVPSLRNRYDNAIHYADHALGKLLAGLERTGALKDTVVVLLTDHGEGWGAHGIFGHSTQHFDEIIEVPLLLRLPGGHAGVDKRRVSTIDVAPTLLAALGLPRDAHYQGHSLLDPRYRPRLHFAWSNNVGTMASLIIDRWKLIWIPNSDERWLFDLEADAKERHNLAGTDAGRVHEAAMLHLLKRLCRAQLQYAAELPVFHPTSGTPTKRHAKHSAP